MKNVVKSAKQRIARAIQPARKGDRLRAAYVYASGFLAALFERTVRSKGLPDQQVTYWRVAHHAFEVSGSTGRVVFHGGAVNFVANADRIRWQGEDVAHGSENTRKRNLAVGGVYCDFGNAWAGISTIDGLSCGITIQPNAAPWSIDTGIGADTLQAEFVGEESAHDAA